MVIGIDLECTEFCKRRENKVPHGKGGVVGRMASAAAAERTDSGAADGVGVGGGSQEQRASTHGISVQ